MEKETKKLKRALCRWKKRRKSARSNDWKKNESIQAERALLLFKILKSVQLLTNAQRFILAIDLRLNIKNTLSNRMEPHRIRRIPFKRCLTPNLKEKFVSKKIWSLVHQISNHMIIFYGDILRRQRTTHCQT